MNEMQEHRLPRVEVELLSSDPKKDLPNNIKNQVLEYLDLEKLLFGLGKRRFSNRGIFDYYARVNNSNVAFLDDVDFSSRSMPFEHKLFYAEALGLEKLHKTLLERRFIEAEPDDAVSEALFVTQPSERVTVDYRAQDLETQYLLIPRLVTQIANAEINAVNELLKNRSIKKDKETAEKPEEKPKLLYDGKDVFEAIGYPREEILWAYGKKLQGMTIINKPGKSDMKNFFDFALAFATSRNFYLLCEPEFAVSYVELSDDKKPVDRSDMKVLITNGTARCEDEDADYLAGKLIEIVSSELRFRKDMLEYLKTQQDGRTVHFVETAVYEKISSDLEAIPLITKEKIADFYLRNVLGSAPAPTNPHETLDVKRGAGREEIIQAFCKKVMELHPDTKDQEEKEIYHNRFVKQFEQLKQSREYLLALLGEQKEAETTLLKYIGRPSEYVKDLTGH